MSFTEFRLKFRRFFRANKRLFLIIIIIWAIIFFINMIFTNRPKEYIPTTTYEEHTAVINSSNKTPKSLQDPIEKVIDEYVGYCNEGNYQKAFNMLSEDCRKYEFNDDVQEFMKHVLTKMPTPKKHAVQSYSSVKYNNKNMYIYEVKYLDDILATGLTNSEYKYTQENMTFYEGEDGLEMNVGNYIYHTDIKSISENEYLKIDVIDKVVNYSIETYEVKFTNRSNYTVVVADTMEKDEVLLTLGNETRQSSGLEKIVLKPNESTTVKFIFPKFVDDGDPSQNLAFPSIRVMEQYSGTGEEVSKETIQSEIDNAIAKFSMEVFVAE